MTKERIEIIRQSLIPFVKKELLKINYEGLGKSDAKEFEKDLNEVLDLAINALEQQTSDEIIKYLECNDIDVQKFTKDMKKQRLQAIKSNISEDCVSRQAVLDILSHYAHNFVADNEIKSLPPVKPTQCIAAVRFSKEDLREICNERIEIECTHGTCKDCKFNVKSTKSTTMCDIGHRFYMREPSTFYCADFVKRGDSDGSN